MLCVSIGMQAAINVYATQTERWIDGGQVSGYGIYDAKPGEIAQLLNGTYVGTVNWSGASLDALKSAVLIKIGSDSDPATLNDDDLAALEKLSGAKYLDIDGCTLADGASISNIKAGSGILAVSLPNNLTKEQVNAAGAALAACNSGFGSCISQAVTMEEKEVTYYPYSLGGSDYEYTGDISALTDNGDGTYNYTITSVERDLAYAEGYPKVTVYITDLYYMGYTTSDGTIEKVSVTEYGNTYDKIMLKLSKFPVKVKGSEGSYYYNDPFTNESVTLSSDDYSNISQYNGLNYIVVDFGSNYQYFSFNNGDAKYKYQYTDLDGNTLYTDETTTADDDMKITIACNETVTITPVTETVEVPAEGARDLIAYVNTAGSLYRATNLAPVTASDIENVVISGNITLDDIAANYDGSDPLNTGLAGLPEGTEKYSKTGVNPGLYLDNKGVSYKILDLLDAHIDDPVYLRVVSNNSAMEKIVFPSDLTAIPVACCYANGTSGNYKLSEVVMPDGVTSIGDYAFHGTAIKEVFIRNNTKYVGYEAFGSSKIENVTFEKGLTDLSFSGYVFDSCEELKHVVLPEGVTNIGNYIFNMCTNLDAIRLPSTLVTLGDGAFHECTSLRSLTIPEGVRSIGKQALSLCYIEDLYLMSQSIEEIPTIYSSGSDGKYEMSSFASNQLNGNNTSPQQNYDDWAQKTSEEMLEEYRKIGSGGGNTLTYLHYNEALRDFIDYNPFYYASGAKQDNEKPYLSDTYLFVDSEGKTWPSKGNDRYTSEGRIGQRGDGEYAGDYERCFQAGDPTAAINADSPYKTSSLDEPSKLGWRQFVLKTGVSSDSPEVLTKEYKDIWYTMCFPWHLTDEQLEDAFSSNFCIAEFTGVKVTEGEDGYTLQLCFDEVAKAQKITDSSYPSMIYSEDGERDPGYLAVAGHPYMIHPATGTNADQSPVKCYITGIHPLDYSKAENANYTADAQKVQKKAMIEKSGSWVEFTDKNGHNATYTFIGNTSNDPGESETQVGSDYTLYNSGTDEAPDYYKYVPQNAYFLAVKKSLSNYPRYFREVRTEAKRESGNKAGKWSLYSAVVYPDASSLGHGGLESMIDGEAAGAKGIDFAMFDFGNLADVEPSETTTVEKIVEDAKKSNVPVQYMNVVFNINGQIVRGDTKDMENLPKGVYIVNGKKYFVK